MAILTVSNNTSITDASSGVIRKLQERLTFRNPKHEENERKGFSNWNVPRELCYLTQDGGALIFPRGFTSQARSIIRDSGVKVEIHDNRRLLTPVEFTFSGQLRDYQQEALKAILARDFSTVSIPTGAGKTVIALAAIVERKQPALIVVHTRELQDQWCRRIETFLGIAQGEIGLIGNGKSNVGQKITVALVQSLHKCASKVSEQIGFLVVDECHRAASRIYIEAVTAFGCRYQLGLSATPYRRDRLNRLIYWHIGDVVCQIDEIDLIESGDILPVEVITRETTFQPTVDPSEQYSTMLTELCEDTQRNTLIVGDVAKKAATNGGGVCLLLSDRKSHCETLKELLTEKGTVASLLTGDLNERERRQVVSDIRTGKAQVIVATIALIGEGFDARELSALFLATPIKFLGRLIQCLGRVLRPAPGKEKAVVYDYVDPVGVLECAARGRLKVYAQAA
jgi:superfamily II DNA or RNA helicase